MNMTDEQLSQRRRRANLLRCPLLGQAVGPQIIKDHECRPSLWSRYRLYVREVRVEYLEQQIRIAEARIRELQRENAELEREYREWAP
jgi:hypothetical protein